MFCSSRGQDWAVENSKFKGQSSSELSGNTGYRGRKATGGRKKPAGYSKTGGPEGKKGRNFKPCI